MLRVVFGPVAALLILAAGPTPPVQDGRPASETGAVEAWFAAVDRLGVAGLNEAEIEAAATGFAGLYADDALHIQGPAGPHQRGGVTVRGRGNIARLAALMAGDWTDFQIRPAVSTARETSEVVRPEAPGPWGGPLVAAEFTIAGTRRSDGARWFAPGAAFFRIRNGRILRARVYLAVGEAAEVEPRP